MMIVMKNHFKDELLRMILSVVGIVIAGRIKKRDDAIDMDIIIDVNTDPNKGR